MIADNAAEADLLRKASLGDEGAFLRIYERHRTPVFRFAALPSAHAVKWLRYRQ